MGKYRPAVILTLALTVFLASCKGATTTTTPTKSWVVTTFASGFNIPYDVAVDSKGNVYVTDYHNSLIRKITPAGVISTFAGGFDNPRGVAVDLSSGNIYVADTANNRIRRIPSDRGLTTIAGDGTAGYADSSGDATQFDGPCGIAVDSSGILYVADTQNHCIRKITSGGVVSTLAGSGTAGFVDSTGFAAQFSSPKGIAVVGTDLYVADTGNNRIRKITIAGGVVTRFAGSGTSGTDDGTGTAAQFSSPQGIAVVGNNLYVADTGNNRIRKITSRGVVTTFAGSSQGYKDATGTSATFDGPQGIAVVGTNLYVADSGNHLIRKITTPTGVVTTFAGTVDTSGTDDGTGTAARFDNPKGVAVVGTNLYVADYGNNCIREISSTGVVSTFAGDGTPAQFNHPSGVAVDSSGNVYVADTDGHLIRKIPSDRGVTTFAGTGTAGQANHADTPTSATFNSPYGVAVGSDGNVYVADTGNKRIRKITPEGEVTTFAGGFGFPEGMAVDSDGILYVADSNNHLIRKITPAGVVSTLAGSGTSGTDDGTGTAAKFYNPVGVAVDSSGNVYVADSYSNRIRKITPAMEVTTIAGDGTEAQFHKPVGVAVDSSGILYVAEYSGHRIRKIEYK